MPTPPSSRVPLLLVTLLTLLGLLRAFLLWSHDPLYAYANSYDQVRYSACFSIYPDRPAEIPPDENSPEAPYAEFRFATARQPMCYWSSELLFGALTAASWRIGEAFGSGPAHSIRLIGALKLLLALVLSIALSRAWLRRGRYGTAIANAALFALLFADPGNTLYLNTFYAEWSSLLALYLLFALLVLWHGEAGDRWRFMAIAATAFLLAASKMQHLVLPLSLAFTLLLVHRWCYGNVGWRAIALLLGGFLGGYFQFVQMQREGPMMDSIRQYNRADVVFTALLPLVDDRAGFLASVGIDPRCDVYAGKHAWELPGLPETVCRGVLDFGYVDQAGVLLRNPRLAVRLAGRAVAALDPWIAKGIGQVEGQVLGRISGSMWSVGQVLHDWPRVQFGVLAAPWLGLLLLVFRRHTLAPALEATALTCTAMLVTLGVTVMGDGLADTAKQGHLVANAGLAWLIVMLALTVWQVSARRRE